MEVIELGLLPEESAIRVVASGAPVYLHINPVEYHGPHLPLSNDYNLSHAVSLDLHRRMQASHPEWPCVLAQPLHIGVEPAPGTGSVGVSFLTARTLVLNACRGLEALGARRVVLGTFHGNPLHNMALEMGVRYLRSRGIAAIAPFHIVMGSMLDYKPGHFDAALAGITDPEQRARMRLELQTDFHAGFFETSLALHYCPDTVSDAYRGLAACPPFRPNPLFMFLARVAGLLGRRRLADECRFVARGLTWTHLKPHPGYTGWPARASREAGAAFAEAIMERYVPQVLAALEGRIDAPAPILSWLTPLTLNGRLIP